jgi:Skp family chaperone for outer membrane proteins
MNAFAASLSSQSDAYAEKWMDERMQRIDKEAVSPEREKQRQEILALSDRMIQDIRAAVVKVAVQEKIEMVWLRPAVRVPLKDITEAVARELANAK